MIAVDLPGSATPTAHRRLLWLAVLRRRQSTCSTRSGSTVLSVISDSLGASRWRSGSAIRTASATSSCSPSLAWRRGRAVRMRLDPAQELDSSGLAPRGADQGMVHRLIQGGQQLDRRWRRCNPTTPTSRPPAAPRSMPLPFRSISMNLTGRAASRLALRTLRPEALFMWARRRRTYRSRSSVTIVDRSPRVGWSWTAEHAAGRAPTVRDPLAAFLTPGPRPAQLARTTSFAVGLAAAPLGRTCPGAWRLVAQRSVYAQGLVQVQRAGSVQSLSSQLVEIAAGTGQSVPAAARASCAQAARTSSARPRRSARPGATWRSPAPARARCRPRSPGGRAGWRAVAAGERQDHPEASANHPIQSASLAQAQRRDVEPAPATPQARGRRKRAARERRMRDALVGERRKAVARPFARAQLLVADRLSKALISSRSRAVVSANSSSLERSAGRQGPC